MSSEELTTLIVQVKLALIMKSVIYKAQDKDL